MLFCHWAPSPSHEEETMARARVPLSQKQLEGLELQLIHAVTVS